MVSTKKYKHGSISLADVFERLPAHPAFEIDIRRAPKRTSELSDADINLALNNALRYCPPEWHDTLKPEFKKELKTHGRIYAYRFRPKGDIVAQPIHHNRGACLAGKAMQVMLDNNLSFDIALYPYELVTYGESGQVCQNWMQYHLIKAYFEILTESQTLHMLSGHPLGLFPSSPEAPRVMITNGLMVGRYDTPHDVARGQAIGVTNYGQMTAGGLMYIGPQGIVHGTYSTLLNAGRLKLNIKENEDLAGILFVSSGLGGMSGAQGKACKIAGGVALIAEVDPSRVKTRHAQGWIDEISNNVGVAVAMALQAKEDKIAKAIAFEGNVLDLLDYLIKHEVDVELLSDQTSCHNVYEGGYCPQGIDFETRTDLLNDDPLTFKSLVDESLLKHIKAIKTLVGRGSYFFDYGNNFLHAVYDAGDKSITKNGHNDLDGFIYPSYVEDILGPLLFDYGYGPFRWVCLSGRDEDLKKTDKAAYATIDQTRRFQDRDNAKWVLEADAHQLVVGTKARILYQDAMGRHAIAKKFNALVREGDIGPIMIGRDHHDTGGTDSPFRETSNIKDGSNITADMAVHAFAGNASRGMTLVALHNGGGVGIGNAINGGFGLVLDGSQRVDAILDRAIPFDVLIGVARRAWAKNAHALDTIASVNDADSHTMITIPFKTD